MVETKTLGAVPKDMLKASSSKLLFYIVFYYSFLKDTIMSDAAGARAIADASLDKILDRCYGMDNNAREKLTDYRDAKPLVCW